MAAYSRQMEISDYGALLVKISTATIIYQSSGCTINDILDRKFDASVERTKNRPIASGRISVTGATIFLILQYIVGIFCFYTMFNKSMLYFFTALMLPMAGIYPLMKRVTHWPQAWLGLCINFGFVASWLAVHNTLFFRPTIPVIMVAALWCWTMIYDTTYACLDKKDDMKVGIGSTAIFFGHAVVHAIVYFAVGFIGLLLVSGVLNGQGALYHVVSVGGSALFFFFKCSTLDVDSTSSCLGFFAQNAYYLGPVLYGGLLLDYIRVIASG